MHIGIVGAGIVGLTIARECRKAFPGSAISILEKNAEFFSETSKYNSGVIHSGIHQLPNLLKSQLAHSGGELLLQFCKENGVPHRKAGMLIAVAPTDIHRVVREVTLVVRLFLNSKRQKLSPPRIVLYKDIRKKEPHIHALMGLFLPDIYVVDQSSLGDNLYKAALREGVMFHFNTRVKKILKCKKSFVIEAGNATQEYTHFINAAGLYADVISDMAGYGGYTVYPYRGEYYEVISEKKHLIRSTLIYPALPPGHPVKGIHFTKTTDGRLLLGPNAHPWLSRTDDFSQRSPKIEFLDAVRRFLPGLTPDDIQWAYAGLRPKLSKGLAECDFIIKKESGPLPFVNLIGIESPGFSASFAIARYVISLLKS